MHSGSIKVLDDQQVQRLLSGLEQCSGRDHAFLSRLLEIGATILHCTEGVVFVTAKGDRPRVASVFPMPEDRRAKIPPDQLNQLRDIALRCRQAAQVHLQSITLQQQEVQIYAMPLVRNGDVEGVMVLWGALSHELSSTNALRIEQAMRACAMYPGHVARRMLERHERQANETRSALNVLAAAHGAEHFQACVMAVCHALRSQTGAARVSLGWSREERIELLAMSDTEHIDPRQDLARRMIEAMEECFDQGQPIVTPTDHLSNEDESLTHMVRRCHASLLEMDSSPGRSLCSIPLRYRDQLVGIITLEWDAISPKPDGQKISLLQAVADLVGPRLHDRELDDQALWIKAWRHARKATGKLIGPEHVGAKISGLAVLAVLIFSCTVKWQYRIESDCVLQAGERHVYAAPFAGFLQNVAVEVGDSVKAGQTLLANFDDSELKLQLAETQGKLVETTTNRMTALGTKDLAQAKRLSAVVMQLEAQRDLLQYQIDRAKLVAAEDGVVLTGDWKQKQGVRVDLGTTIFEIAPIERLRVSILVDESEIDRVRVDQQGVIATRAYPEQGFPFKVTRIVPVGQAKDGSNVFEVRGELKNHAPWMRPDMRGKAKIEAGRARVIWIYTHVWIDYLRLHLWF